MTEQFTTSAKRKLLPEEHLKEIKNKVDIGVPLTKAYGDLDICRPAVAKLLKYYAWYAVVTFFNSKSKAIIYASLFPSWLDDDKTIQVQPDGWSYKGAFPLGEWIQTE